MVRTVNKGDLDVDYWVTSNDTVLKSLTDALIDRWDVLLRNNTTDDSVDKLVTLALFLWLKVDDCVAILTLTTGLTDKLALSVAYCLTSSLTVSNLWLTNIAVNLKLTTETVNNNLKVKLAHTSNDGLASLVISVNLEGWVLFSQLRKADGHLLLLSLGLRLNSNVDNRICEADGLKDDWVLLVTKGVTSSGVL